MFKPVPIGNAKLGIDLMSDEAALPEGAVRDAVNFDIDAAGMLHSRDGATRLDAGAGRHSLWSPTSKAFGLYADGTTLRMLREDLTAIHLLAGLSTSERMHYAEHADNVFFTNARQVGILDRRGARLLGVPVPDQPGVAEVQGGLPPGRYGITISYADRHGEEGGCAPAVFIDITQGGIEVLLPNPPAGAVEARIYATPQNGDELYQAAAVPAAMPTARVQNPPAGKLANTRFMVPMPAGSAIAAYNGRVFVARGTRIAYSEPYAFGRHDPRFNWLDLASPVRFLAAVADGLYAGTPAGTVFVSGSGPKDMGYRLVGPAPRADGAIVLPASHIGGEGEARTVVWVGRSGFSIGGAGGAVRSPQQARIRLDEHGPANLCALTRRGICQVVAVVSSTNPAVSEAAIDSPY